MRPIVVVFWLAGATVLAGIGTGVKAVQALQVALSDSSFTDPEDSPVVEPERDPHVRMETMAGTLVEHDAVRDFIRVRATDGQVREFFVDSVTPVLEWNRLQIPFDRLQAGDRLVVHFETEPLKVQKIVRQSPVPAPD